MWQAVDVRGQSFLSVESRLYHRYWREDDGGMRVRRGKAFNLSVSGVKALGNCQFYATVAGLGILPSGGALLFSAAIILTFFAKGSN